MFGMMINVLGSSRAGELSIRSIDKATADTPADRFYHDAKALAEAFNTNLPSGTTDRFMMMMLGRYLDDERARSDANERQHIIESMYETFMLFSRRVNGG